MYLLVTSSSVACIERLEYFSILRRYLANKNELLCILGFATRVTSRLLLKLDL
jgi:hypothetical protein